MKFKERLQAIDLRKRGLSYKEILPRVNVSKGTLSHWLKDIELTSEQKEKLMTKKLLSSYKGAKSNQKYAEQRRMLIMQKAKREVAYLVKNPLFIAGLMLYWAEGAKGYYEKVAFSNSDPELVRLMMRWLREICHVEETHFRISLYIHKFHVRKNVRNFWSKVTGVPIGQFRKEVIKPTIHSQRTNKLYEGTCRVDITRADLFRRIMGWEMGIKEYFAKHQKLSVNINPDFIEGVVFQHMQKWSKINNGSRVIS